jgi:hypothetical protein
VIRYTYTRLERYTQVVIEHAGESATASGGPPRTLALASTIAGAALGFARFVLIDIVFCGTCWLLETAISSTRWTVNCGLMLSAIAVERTYKRDPRSAMRLGLLLPLITLTSTASASMATIALLQRASRATHALVEHVAEVKLQASLEDLPLTVLNFVGAYGTALLAVLTMLMLLRSTSAWLWHVSRRPRARLRAAWRSAAALQRVQPRPSELTSHASALVVHSFAALLPPPPPPLVRRCVAVIVLRPAEHRSLSTPVKFKD